MRASPRPLLASLLIAWSLLGVTELANAQDEAPPEDRGSGAIPSGSSAAVVKPAPDARQPVIVPPRPVRFAEPPFPPAALEAGIRSARVKLTVTVDAQGKVTAVEVLEPAGYGFDEAARAAVSAAEWTPATRDGVVIPGGATTAIVYEFQAPPPRPSLPPSAPPPTTGELGGVVRVTGVDAPLAGAEIIVTGPGGAEQRVRADEQGRWSLQGLAAGTYRVRVKLAGFEGLESSEEVTPGEATELTYRLDPEAEETEIVIRGERPPREVTRRTLERREIASIPGTRGDAIRSVENLPGVARPPGLAGILIVRGSAPNDTATFVDGANVPIIYHFGGLSTVIPTELVERIDFYPGNFSARYGRYMGGIVDVGMRSPDTRCRGPYGRALSPTVARERAGCYHGLLQLDLIDGRAMLEGPLPVKNWSFAVAGRRSWFDAWLKPVLVAADAGVTSAPRYYDYQVIAETRPSPRSKLSIRGFGSDDRLQILIKDPFANDPGFGGNIRFGIQSHLAQIIYTDALSDDVELNVMVSWGKQTLDFGIGNLLFVLDSYPLTYRSEIGWRLARSVKLNTGVDFLLLPFEVAARAPPLPREGEPDPGPFSTRPPLEQNIQDTGFRPAWYVEAEVTPTRRLRVVPGIRVDYARDSSSADFSPRLSARYDVVSPTEDAVGGRPARRTTLKGGVGFFHQPPEFQETSAVFGTPDLISNRAIHYGVGVEQELTRSLEASVEGFYKDMTNLVATPPLGSADFYANQGTGSAIGLETLIKYKPDRRFFGWLAYTLSRSVRQDNPAAEERLFDFDQTHILTVLGSYRLGRGWEAGGRFRLVSGNLYTPVLSPPSVGGIFAADAGTYAAVSGEPYSRRLPLYHSLDVRVDKRWQFRTWRLSAYLDVQNAYNNPAVEGISYNYNYSQSTNMTGIPILPALGVRGDF